MTDLAAPVPKYKISESIDTALDLAMRALEEIRQLARQPGPSGKDGKDGRDGLSIEDLSIDYDGERTFTFRFANGTNVKEFPFIVPITIDRGVYKQDTPYQRGDVVSYGGSAWIAQRDTSDKPENSDAWRLAVKRGRDGRDFNKP